MDTGIADIDAIEDASSLDALDYQLLMMDGDAMITEDDDYLILEEYRVDTIAPDADNLFIEKEGDKILDFTESNPFGDPGGGSY